MADSGIKPKNIPGILEFEGELDPEEDYILATNYSLAHIRARVETEILLGKTAQEALAQMDDDFLLPVETGIKDEEFLTRIFGFTTKYGQEVLFAEDDMICMVGDDDVIEMLKTECGAKFEYAPLDSAGVEEVVEKEQQLVGSETAETGQVVTHFRPQTLPEPGPD